MGHVNIALWMRSHHVERETKRNNNYVTLTSDKSDTVVGALPQYSIKIANAFAEYETRRGCAVTAVDPAPPEGT